jgi:beta-glucosidase-like glycosyl hydrolase
VSAGGWLPGPILTDCFGDYSGKTALNFWAPNMNILRDPRWGRAQGEHKSNLPLLGGL